MARTVYAVTEGSYSDYRIVYIFEDRDTAEEFKKIYGGWNVDIEEFEMCGPSELPFRFKTYYAQATLRDDFTVSDVRHSSISAWGHSGDVPKRPEVEYSRDRFLGDKAGFLVVKGVSEEAVKKVLSERLASFKAMSWIPQGQKAVPKPT